jgi:hypothetical protein
MNEVQKALRKRYEKLHPLIFQRSLERARSDGDLFDLLDAFPDKFPVIWNQEQRRWDHTGDLLQDGEARKFFKHTGFKHDEF